MTESSSPSLHPLPVGVALAAALFLAGCASTPPTLGPVGEYALPATAPEGLSGIAWLGDDRYALAEDSGGRIHFARIGLDRTTGAITNCTFTETWTIPGLVDAEGIAFDSRSGTLHVSDESSSQIFQIQNGAIPQLKHKFIYIDHIRPNKSLEALTYDTTYYKWNRDDSILWTANEDALTLDGPTSSATNAALVRIMAVPMHIKFFPLLGDWFYRLDAAQGGPVPGAGKDVPFNGLVGLAALGDGKLLVLERSCGLAQSNDGGAPSLITSSIYFVDASRAKPGSPTPLKKTLLWRQGFPFSNYEGITLGPKLDDGSRAVLLVADGDVSKARVGGIPVTLQWKKALFALKLTP